MIRDIKGCRIYNSRGEPTILVKVTTDSGVFSGSAPSGKSRSSYEAYVFDMEKSLKILEEIKHNFIGLTEDDFGIMDQMVEEMAGKNFQKIGAHLGFALTSALLKASTFGDPFKYFDDVRFPYPIVNVVGGGKHGGGTDIQEFHVIPVKAETFPEAIKTCLEAQKRIRTILLSRHEFAGKNDENALVSGLSEEKTLETISEIAEDLEARIGVDIAASSLYHRTKKRYVYEKLDREAFPEQQMEAVKELIETWKVYYVEDPFHEDDFKSFAELLDWKGKRELLVCGDDLFSTNMDRLKRGLRYHSCNSIIIKPNQAGTIGMAMRVAEHAARRGYKIVVSHRSGETNDPVIADLALGLGHFIKTGVWGGERLAKMNRLLEIWENLEYPKMASLRT
ncbi:MAG: hypothetical protein JSV92_05180 [archaeon]|nr:MAG: hypothetical protein JSV92_05180 [archaeon]